jgi:hypothetical protein
MLIVNFYFLCRNTDSRNNHNMLDCATAIINILYCGDANEVCGMNDRSYEIIIIVIFLQVEESKANN